MIETALVASPRCANPGPVTTGVTPVTPGIRATSARIFCHWSTERSCCERGWTCIGDRVGVALPQGRATWSGAWIWIGAWKLSVRRMMLACNPASNADMKMMTPPPRATPKTMRNVCVSPSRMNRKATTGAKYERGFIACCRPPED